MAKYLPIFGGPLDGQLHYRSRPIPENYIYGESYLTDAHGNPITERRAILLFSQLNLQRVDQMIICKNTHPDLVKSDDS